MIAIFLLSLLVIVSVHEAGHYFLARFFKVGIHTFSIGLGKTIVSFFAKKQGTFFQVGVFPIGGYVKFSEEPMPNKVLYTSLCAWKKIVILLAGPMFNFIMAFLILLGLLQTLNYQMYPMIRLPNANEVKITELNKQAVNSWAELKTILDKDQEIGSIKLKRLSDDKALVYQLKPGTVKGNLNQWLALQDFSIFYPALPAIIGGFSAQSSAKAAGLQLDDKILAINEESISDINALVNCLEKYPDMNVNVRFLRQGEILSTRITLASRYLGRKKVGVLGVKTYEISAYPQWYHPVNYTWAQTFRHGFLGIIDILGLQTNGWKHIDREYKAISGPIGIAYAAHQAWSMSFKAYFLFLVWLNLGVGVMNLLPLPILDGGQCLMVLIEKWFPNLLTMRLKNLLALLSVMLLFCLIAVGFHNDWLFLQ